MLAITLWVAGATVSATTTSAATLPPYTHSWYITNTDGALMGAMYHLGYNDGARDNTNPCSGTARFIGTTVLDFGQISNKGTAGYGGYGVYDFGPSLWDTLSVVETAARRYAHGWWDATSACPFLNVVVGLNNYNFCALNTAPCSPNGAGQQWGYLVKNVQSDLVADGTSPQVTAWAGGDFETGHNPTGWECATRTTQFTDGY